jgi:sugar lactone lactonase YvrE
LIISAACANVTSLFLLLLFRGGTMRRSGRGLAPLALFLLASCSDPEPPAAVESESTVEVLARGSHFRGVNGILFGPDGLLYAASVVTPALAAIDPESGAIKTQWGAAEGAKGPDDLAFGPDGSVYWTDIIFGDVVRRSPDGTTKVIASPGPGVNPITFSDDGRLFVSQCFLGDKLFELDPEGANPPRVISDQLGPGCGLNGMDWGPDDKLYGPRWFQGKVARVDVDSGRVETVAEGFGVPAAVKFDSKGRLHVLDTLRGEIVRVDTAAGTREVVGRVQPSSADNLAFLPRSRASAATGDPAGAGSPENDANDRLFVSSFGDSFIVEVLDAERKRTVLAGGVSIPGGLALASGGAGAPVLYVADFFALRGLDPASGKEVYAARDVIGFSALGSTMTVAAWGDRLITTSWFDNAVKVWDPKTDQAVVSWTGLKRPIHARAFQGEVVVTEWDTGSVLRLKEAEPDSRTAIATGIATPTGLAASGDDLYVADREAGRVVQIVEGGNVLSPVREVARGLAGPEGVEVAEDGSLYVVEAEADRLSRIDPESGRTELVADGLALQVAPQGAFPTTMLFNGLAVGAERIYVTGDLENVIYSIARK